MCSIEYDVRDPIEKSWKQDFLNQITFADTNNTGSSV